MAKLICPSNHSNNGAIVAWLASEALGSNDIMLDNRPSITVEPELIVD